MWIYCINFLLVGEAHRAHSDYKAIIRGTLFLFIEAPIRTEARMALARSFALGFKMLLWTDATDAN